MTDRTTEILGWMKSRRDDDIRRSGYFLQSLIADMEEAMRCAVCNAVAIPDPAMNGEADCYTVPMDDIDKMRTFLPNAGIHRTSEAQHNEKG